jgi:hypothetical protein
MDCGRELELEIQNSEQKMHDINFFKQIHPDAKDKELAFQIGYIQGIKWCMNRFKDGR